MITLNQLTDTQLVAIYQKNNSTEYYGELYNRYYKKVYHYCLGKVKNRDDAYDITADTFVKLITKIKGLRNPELFIAWLFKIANNACMDTLKMNGNHKIVEKFALESIEEDNADMEERYSKEVQLDLLDQVFNDLDFETRTLFMNRYFKGKSVDQLEKEMGLSKSAVKMRLARGRNKIGHLIEKKQALIPK